MWLILFSLAATGAVLIPEDCKNVTLCGQLPWSEWTACSQTCGGGSQTRKQEICGLPEWGEEEVEDRCGKPLRIEHRVCKAECRNSGMFADDTCICKPGNTDLVNKLGALTISREMASSFIRIRKSRNIDELRFGERNINEECSEKQSCSYEEVREWISPPKGINTVCEWMKTKQCKDTCRAGYHCETTNSTCSMDSRLMDIKVTCTDIDINECANDPCMHGGTCNNLVNMFTCSCPDGYRGTRCENDINECDSNPCKHGGICNDLVNRFTCSCRDGYNGTRCEHDINECNSNPCKHGGTCHNSVNRFTCSCRDGYHGTQCEYDINECNSNPCMHGGTCHNLVNKFTCSCPAGYSGTRCEDDINECDSSPCMHGGICDDLLNMFTCLCPIAYSGTQCEDDASIDAPAVMGIIISVLLLIVVILVIAVVIKRKMCRNRSNSDNSAYEMQTGKV